MPENGFDLYCHAHALALEDAQVNVEATIAYLTHFLTLSQLSRVDDLEMDRTIRSAAAHFKAALASFSDAKRRRAAA